MYQKTNGKDSVHLGTDASASFASIRQYELPKYRRNKAGSYVEYYAFNPLTGKLGRVRIKLNHIEPVKKRNEYAKDLIKRLTLSLQRGYNPFICKDATDLVLFEDCMKRYNEYLDKMIANGYYRKETYAGYKSYAKILCAYVRDINPIYYAYQFDSGFCSAFLDYVFIERNNSAQTRNNYLRFLGSLSQFFIEKDYIKTKPTDKIKPISKRLIQKSRTVIPSKEVAKIQAYGLEHDRHFLFACYLLYYCFIRPVEMTRLKIGDIDIKSCTITIGEQQSKNHKRQTVTMPKKVLHYAIDLGLFKHPSSSYIFSTQLLPGAVPIDTKIFRDHWAKLRAALKFKKTWTFYSLKDTGITEMLNDNMATISIRDQARHSSLAITDIYTSHDAKANAEIIEHDGSL